MLDVRFCLQVATRSKTVWAPKLDFALKKLLVLRQLWWDTLTLLTIKHCQQRQIYEEYWTLFDIHVEQGLVA